MSKSREIVFSPKLQPLFNLKTRYCVLIGGRAGGKSFALASATACATYDDSYNVLFLRYTMVSAELSIIPEFMDKLDLLASRGDFVTRKHDVVNRGTGSRIFFRGAKTGSKSQTASLKSLHAVKMVVYDEAEEFVDEKEFDTIDDSLREKDADIHVILCLNQPDVGHWIYRRFYQEAGVPEDFAGIRGDVTYIPITYLDNIHNLNESFLAKVERMRQRDPEKYEHVYGLAWERIKAGLIYTGWKRDAVAGEATRNGDSWYGVDWGFTNDPTAIVRLWYDSDTGILYVSEVAYAKGLLIGQIARLLQADMEVSGCTDALVYCDPARPEHIAELRRTYNINACPADNRDKPGRVDWLKGCDVHYDGDNIDEERKAYSYIPSKNDPNLYTNVPQDGGDHLMDAINYGGVTHLRRQGIPNSLGET